MNLFKSAGVFLGVAVITLVIIFGFMEYRAMAQSIQTRGYFGDTTTPTTETRVFGTGNTLSMIASVEVTTSAAVAGQIPASRGYGVLVVDTVAEDLYFALNPTTGAAVVYKIAAAKE